ncbi:MAG: ATP-binding cassette domain-containing protein [Planctomycetia bacterium]|nr:ATP-binding cassette domain-containing protein [Planctomycetia bacterium]
MHIAPYTNERRTGTDCAESGDDVVLRFDQVSLRFGRSEIIRNISLTLRRGESLAIIGESGCGKTCTLKLAIGLFQATRGTVTFCGEDLAKQRSDHLAKLRTRYGFLFQQAALFDSMSVADNIVFPLRQHRPDMSESEMFRTASNRLVEVGLNPDVVLCKYPAELSGGMRKRVGLARALALEPELMLYDEPTTGLDPVMSSVINELILRTRLRRPVTSLIVTHDMTTVMKAATRVVMLGPLADLKTGEDQILFDGTPQELQKSQIPVVRQFVRGEAGDRIDVIDAASESFSGVQEVRFEGVEKHPIQEF